MSRQHSHGSTGSAPGRSVLGTRPRAGAYGRCTLEPGPHCALTPGPDAARTPAAHDDGAGGHGGAHGHQHDAAAMARDGGGARVLKWVLALTGVFMLAELVGGIVSNSLALLADAGHMFTDVGAIGLSLFAIWFARRPPTPEKTYGYLRLEILAALLNGTTLLVIAGVIFYEAFQRFTRPEDVHSGIMLAVATGGLVVNVVAALLLHRSAGESLNVRGAYLHVLGDLLGSVGAIAAALVIMTTGWTAADPIISVVVALLILFSSWKLVREAVDILLEAVPSHIDMGEVQRAIDAIPGVGNVHDLHVWTVTSGYLAMSGHAVVAEPLDHQRVLAQIHECMRHDFGIDHITFQLERF